MEYFSYVKCDYNNGDGFWCVDAWRTDDDNEEGKVVAYVHETTGDVAYADPDARFSPLVKEVVDAKVKEIMEENFADKRNQLIIRIWASFCFNFSNYNSIVRYMCEKTDQTYLVPHIESKFVTACNSYGTHAAMNVFYSNLDKKLRNALVDYAIHKYAAKSMYLSDEEKKLVGI